MILQLSWAKNETLSWSNLPVKLYTNPRKSFKDSGLNSKVQAVFNEVKACSTNFGHKTQNREFWSKTLLDLTIWRCKRIVLSRKQRKSWIKTWCKIDKIKGSDTESFLWTSWRICWWMSTMSKQDSCASLLVCWAAISSQLTSEPQETKSKFDSSRDACRCLISECNHSGSHSISASWIYCSERQASMTLLTMWKSSSWTMMDRRSNLLSSASAKQRAKWCLQSLMSP